MITVNRRIVSVNQKLCDVWGYTSSELIGSTTCKLYANKEDFKNVGLLLQFNKEFTTTAHLKKKNGGIIFSHIKVTKNEQENYVTVYFDGILEES